MTAGGPGARDVGGFATAGPGARVRLDRAQALFDAWRAIDGVTAPEAKELERALLAAFAHDRERYSDIFEASFSIDERGEHAYRFSYAFPGFKARGGGEGEGATRAVKTALACAAPFGAGVVAATRRMFRAAMEPAVEQPLLGLAWDRDGAPRHKVYLQFTNGAAREAAALTERVLAMPGLAAHLGDAALHMLGVDFGPNGLLGAKLYVAHPRVVASNDEGADPIARALAKLAPPPPAPGPDAARSMRTQPDPETARGMCTQPTPDTAPGMCTHPESHAARTMCTQPPPSATPGMCTQAAPRPFVNVLAIHRLGADIRTNLDALPPVTDVDLGLADNALTWHDLAAAPWISEHLAGGRGVRALLDEFRVGVRRVSISAEPASRLSVYYVLREVEEP